MVWMWCRGRSMVTPEDGNVLAPVLLVLAPLVLVLLLLLVLVVVVVLLLGDTGLGLGSLDGGRRESEICK